MNGNVSKNVSIVWSSWSSGLQVKPTYTKCLKDTYVGSLCAPLTGVTISQNLTHQFIGHSTLIFH